MWKNEPLTPKAIANQIKSKGLQKLRWYFQRCQKQCRDENGFKCHYMSESHQRQMQNFGQNPHRIVEGYTEEFESTFMEHMKRSHRYSRIAATVVYNEYINDRHHVHMNSTKWATLTEFVNHLGRTGQCKVEETAKGWFITYIDRDSETLFKERQKNKWIQADMVEEEKNEREIRKQIERAEQMIVPTSGDNPAEVALVKPDNGEKIAFALGSSSKVIGKEEVSRTVFNDDDDDDDGNDKKKKRLSGNESKSALDELMREEERAKEKSNRKDYWLFDGIVVKVMSKALVEKGYYKKKGVVRKFIDKYAGEVKMVDSGHVMQVDREELEIVIPQIGGVVKIVNGEYRGSNARLLAVYMDKFCAKVQIEKGFYDGRIIKAIEYEDICKIP